VRGHVIYFLKFWDPLHISETVEARNIKFGMQTGHWGTGEMSSRLWLIVAN